MIEILKNKFNEAFMFAKKEGTDKKLETEIFSTDLSLSDLENASPTNVTIAEIENGYELGWYVEKWEEEYQNDADIIGLKATYDQSGNLIEAKFYTSYVTLN